MMPLLGPCDRHWYHEAVLVPLHGAAGTRANGANRVNGAPVLTDSMVQLHGAT